jgi:hypothetical protein
MNTEPMWTEPCGDLIAVGHGGALTRAPAEGPSGTRGDQLLTAGERSAGRCHRSCDHPLRHGPASCGTRMTSSRLITGSLRETIAGPISLWKVEGSNVAEMTCRHGAMACVPTRVP